MRRLAPLLSVALFVPAVALAQWTPQESGTNAEFRGLSAVSPKIVWASGTRGRVARTVDGGATWQIDTVAGADSLDLRAIHAFDARTAVAISAGEAEKGQAKIYRTSDGGRSWSLVWETNQKGVFLDAIAFWDAKHGLILSDPVEGKLFLLTTSDGGASWRRIPPHALPAPLPNEGFFAASGTCLTTSGPSSAYIGSGGAATARVFRTTDRGRTWHAADTPLHAGDPASGVFSVVFRDAKHGVAVGGRYDRPHESLPNVALSDDGGATWHAPDGTLPVGYYSGAAWVPHAKTPTVVAVGLAGTVRSVDGGRSWATVDSVAYNSVAFAAPNVGWAVGPRGRIAKWSGSAETPAKR